MLDQGEMEEERRLMYVGITRAKEKVYLLFTSQRNIFGSTQVNPPSRFLDDIPPHLLQDAKDEKSQNTRLASTSGFRESRRAKHKTLIRPDAHQDTLSQREREIQKKNTFKDGDRVRHEIFGDGLIVGSQGDTLTVAFSKSGLKKLSASVAPLKKI
jgi:DNA helicase-2/ATP-dependent DNA helicase PcrA